MNWHEIFKYDESSPTCIRWKDPYRKGKGGVRTRRKNDCVAGGITSTGTLAVTINKKPTLVSKIVWEMHHGKIPEGRYVMYKDGDNFNTRIDNLELNIIFESSHKYDSYLGEFFYYDETSPSFIRWKRVSAKGSKVSVGDVAGSLDGGYWKLHLFGVSLESHKVVWALHNNFENQDGQLIDHIDRNPSNNNIENLRLIRRDFNQRNRGKNSNNTSGVHGVSYQEFYNHRGTLIMRYVASVNIFDESGGKSGKKVSKSFSVAKYGDEVALSMAKDWREDQIRIQNENGAGYTDTHGLEK